MLSEEIFDSVRTLSKLEPLLVSVTVTESISSLKHRIESELKLENKIVALACCGHVVEDKVVIENKECDNSIKYLWSEMVHHKHMSESSSCMNIVAVEEAEPRPQVSSADWECKVCKRMNNMSFSQCPVCDGEKKRVYMTCPKGHSLKRHQTGNSNMFCDLCNVVENKVNRPSPKFPKGSVMFGCRACDWDACEACFSSYTMRSDLHEHPLRTIEAKGRSCDVKGCAAPHMTSGFSLTCPQCDWDTCETCMDADDLLDEPSQAPDATGGCGRNGGQTRPPRGGVRVCILAFL